MSLAPIVIFVYNRLTHTQKAIESLKNNFLADKSKLFIVSDAPKDSSAINAVNEVREYIKTIDGFQEITIIEREENYGLANTLINAVTDIINEYKKIIVIEDDSITSKYFLKYMNDALDFYENEENVISISGYSYPLKGEMPETFFLKGADSWGVGTWKRGWDFFERDGQKLLKALKEKKLTKKFDINDSCGFTKMLKNQIKGKNNSWAVRWYASAFLNDKLTLYPGKSMLQNIGFDGTGIHCKESTNMYDVMLNDKPVEVMPIPIKENFLALENLEQFYLSYNSKLTFSQNLINKIKEGLCL